MYVPTYLPTYLPTLSCEFYLYFIIANENGENFMMHLVSLITILLPDNSLMKVHSHWSTQLISTNLNELNYRITV